MRDNNSLAEGTPLKDTKNPTALAEKRRKTEIARLQAVVDSPGGRDKLLKLLECKLDELHDPHSDL